MKTFTQMVTTKEISRRNAYKIGLDAIHEEPGFNFREEGEDLQASIIALADFLVNGGRVPALEVRPREEGGVYVVDGHRRKRAFEYANKHLGGAFDFVDVEAFDGDEKQRIARVITSAEGRPLSQLEQAAGFRRLADTGLNSAEIAKLVNKTRQQVDNMLLLSAAPVEVKEMVKEGNVSATTAVQSIRKHREKAGEELKKDLHKAESSGKRKVTAATQNTKPLPIGVPIKFDVPATISIDKWEALYRAVQTHLESEDDERDFMKLRAAFNGIADLKG